MTEKYITSRTLVNRVRFFDSSVFQSIGLICPMMFGTKHTAIVSPKRTLTNIFLVFAKYISNTLILGCSFDFYYFFLDDFVIGIRINIKLDMHMFGELLLYFLAIQSVFLTNNLHDINHNLG